MAVDSLQSKIKKMKSPIMVDLTVRAEALPQNLLEQNGSLMAAYSAWCDRMLTALKPEVPAVRFRFLPFALLGESGIMELKKQMRIAVKKGFYVLLSIPDSADAETAELTARVIWGEGSDFCCDAVSVSGYCGSEILKPFLPYCAEAKKDIFVSIRTAGKTSSELQDLLSGSRMVHYIAADYAWRSGSSLVGKCGYSSVAVSSSALGADSIKMLRSGFPHQFMLIEGIEVSGANAKNCSNAFDAFGHGAVVCLAGSVTEAWKEHPENPDVYAEYAVAAVQQFRKRLERYVSVL